MALMKGYFRTQAKYMDEYSTTLDNEMKIWYPSLEQALNAGIQLNNLSTYNHNADNLQDIINSKNAAIDMREALENGIEGNIGYLSAVVDLPKMTIELNKSRKRLIHTLESFIEQQRSGLLLITSLIEAYDATIDKINNN